MRSVWVLLTRGQAGLEAVRKDLRWQRIPRRPGPVWTDTFSNLLGVWKAEER
jgi:hypothetical protein